VERGIIGILWWSRYESERFERIHWSYPAVIYGLLMTLSRIKRKEFIESMEVFFGSE
jgi:hypothetical protein